MILSEASVLTPLFIDKIHGDEKMIRHLQTMGLTSGMEIVLLRNDNGAVVLRVCDSRIALDKKTAMSIEVLVK